MTTGIVLNRNRKVPAEETPAFGAIAERFRRAGDLERAVTLCRDGLRRFPGHLSARVTLGWSLLDLGRYDEAREALEQVLKRAPDNLAAIRGLAELHDRAEHTMMLPMDGPGQWPPSIEETDQTPAPAASAALQPQADVLTAEVAAVAEAHIHDEARTPVEDLEPAFEFPPPLAIPTSSGTVSADALLVSSIEEPAALASSELDIDVRLEADADQAEAAIDAVAALPEPAVALDGANGLSGEAMALGDREQDVPIVEIEEDQDLAAVGTAIGLDAAPAGEPAQEDDSEEIAALEALIAQARALEEPEFALTSQSILELNAMPREDEAAGDELEQVNGSAGEMPLIALCDSWLPEPVPAPSAPVMEPAPVEKPAQVEKPTPVMKPAPVMKSAPVVKPAPVAKPAPAVKPVPVVKLAPVVKAPPVVKPAVIALERFLRRVEARRQSLARQSMA